MDKLLEESWALDLAGLEFETYATRVLTPYYNVTARSLPIRKEG
jgi:hypothetical protein